jgi:hypothetical protein
VRRKIPGPTRDEVRGERRQLKDDEFNDVHSYYSVYHDKTRLAGEYDTYFGEEACNEVFVWET